jgi:uncharacterized low-complexity protein
MSMTLRAVLLGLMALLSAALLSVPAHAQTASCTASTESQCTAGQAVADRARAGANTEGETGAAAAAAAQGGDARRRRWSGLPSMILGLDPGQATCVLQQDVWRTDPHETRIGLDRRVDTDAAELLYGVLHAAGPGHGKAVVSAWLLANERQLRRGVLISFMAAGGAGHDGDRTCHRLAAVGQGGRQDGKVDGRRT